MGVIYQIRDWNEHFENDRSRVRDSCRFVCMPNKQHGMGFAAIMSESDGGTIYGIWALIVQACSQQKRPRNGWLTANGDPMGSPWGPKDLALKFRRPEVEIVRCLEVVSRPDIDWMIAHGGPITADSPPPHHSLTTQYNEGKKADHPPSPPPPFSGDRDSLRDNDKAGSQVPANQKQGSNSPPSHHGLTVQSPRKERNGMERKGEGEMENAPSDLEDWKIDKDVSRLRKLIQEEADRQKPDQEILKRHRERLRALRDELRTRGKTEPR